MINMSYFKKFIPYLLILSAFVVIAYLFTPQVFEGKVVNQSDISSWRGMAQEIISYNENNPDSTPALWTNSMFSGMPATTISVVYEGDYTDYIYKSLFWGVRPPSYLILCMVGAFLMFLAFGVNIYIAFIGAIAVTFCSYNLQIIQVGHNSKMVAIAFMPWVIAAVAYAFRYKRLWGALFFAFALSFQIKANHPQITYYLAMIVLAYGLSELIFAVKERRFKPFLYTALVLLVAGTFGIASNVNHLWPTYEYSKYTMRGGSEIKSEENPESTDSKGLDLEYATQWSYSPSEIPNLFIPNFNGGSSSGELSKDSEVYRVLKENNYRGAEQVIKQLPIYWGGQPFTAGPMYMGAITIFLFVLALFLLGAKYKWWVLIVSGVSILLSWGGHFMPFTELFFKYAPLYNKFRTVSMILVILQITLPLLAFIVLNKIVNGSFEKVKVKRAFILSLSFTAGVSLLFAIFPSLAGSFTSGYDSSLPKAIADALIEDRQSLLAADALRSFAYVILAATAIWFANEGRLKVKYMYIILALLVSVDMLGAGKRYLNSDHFVKKYNFENQYNKRAVDEIILKDNDPNYRVLDLSVNTFNDSHVSYHHKTIGGYSPAKLQRYQDLIDYYISPEMARISKDLEGSQSIEDAQQKFGNYPVLNMLNTKYVVLGADIPPIENINRYGNCWFADSIVFVSGAKEEIVSLSRYNLSNTAIVERTFEPIVPKVIEKGDSLDYIKLSSYSPNELIYEYSTAKERVAIFSEVYYPKGWKAYIDGEEVSIFRSNYILRSLLLKPGRHEIKFSFLPESFVKGERYSSVISLMMILALLFMAAFELRRIYKRS